MTAVIENGEVAIARLDEARHSDACADLLSSFIYSVVLRRGLFQPGTSHFLYIPTVVGNLDLVTDLMRIYG
jgi:hypothetical protein